MPHIKIWGFSESPFVRTVRMVMAEKGFVGYDQEPISVFTGDHRSPEHLERHPFGKIPVVDVDGSRLIEPVAITRYLDAILSGRALIPSDPKDAARMDMAISLLDKYGSTSINWGVLGYHLFPHLIGGRDDAQYQLHLADGKRVVTELMQMKGADPWLAGSEISLADLFLAPTFSYIQSTPAKDEFLALDGVEPWWNAITRRESYLQTAT